ncbi:PREDICTED: E3 ubiquitin-protein ligase RNF12-like [Ipomoea nil]|uniref:E3 ubiquitin-protein ligase RNF12-like n=1 Tax=Ipomoea nil TaxID=35883 RepID=UPI0009019308|nr:PREDICTED: E3 ubiquitin-protein ligase RNF12-like [Ipomoea nil]
MERESGSNNGTPPRFRPVRLFGVDITLPVNGDGRRQPTTPLQIHSLTITQLIDSFSPGNTTNPPAFHSSLAGGLLRNSSSVTSDATTITVVEEESEVAVLPPPPSPPHSHPHQSAVPPPLPQIDTRDANNSSIMDERNLQMQVENGLREAGDVDPDMVNSVVQLILDTLEVLEDNVDHDDILNVHLSIQLEEIMEDSYDEQAGLSEEVIMSHLGTSTFETSSDEDKDSCCICLDEFSTGDELGKINCYHKFHFMCILEWLKRNNICPVCRAIALSVS